MAIEGFNLKVDIKGTYGEIVTIEDRVINTEFQAGAEQIIQALDL